MPPSSWKDQQRESSQVALWTAHADRVSTEHAHAFDEYVLVVEGRCVVVLGEERIELRTGQELVIPKDRAFMGLASLSDGDASHNGRLADALTRCSLFRGSRCSPPPRTGASRGLA